MWSLPLTSSQSAVRPDSQSEPTAAKTQVSVLRASRPSFAWNIFREVFADLAVGEEQINKEEKTVFLNVQMSKRERHVLTHSSSQEIFTDHLCKHTDEQVVPLCSSLLST